ncbi:hypothetical protein JR316_0003285 [Psilocybe cubensis]|uniref:Uncharacterized protein n=1 Tax=Psilocybe cubensis TaxID=181762 RepID=A0ACB8H841_PSICU|nr:hypothetical protein JR316_0003285 [Psilocybe cubensis]KAH9483807.1 hypothetical protein JR316_0003285 [Psilocybe cubensis]
MESVATSSLQIPLDVFLAERLKTLPVNSETIDDHMVVNGEITSPEIEKLNNELFGPEPKQWGDIPNFNNQRERSLDILIEEHVDYGENNEDLYNGYYDDHYVDRQRLSHLEMITTQQSTGWKRRSSL